MKEQKMEKVKESVIRTIRRTIKKNEDRLLTIPNVKFITIGRKVVSGLVTDDYAIRIYVKKKYKATGKNSIPSLIKAIGPKGKILSFSFQTDVQEQPSGFNFFSYGGGDGIVGATKGSVGLAFISKEDNEYILTNSHVVARPGTTAFGKIVNNIMSKEVGIVSRMTKIQKDKINRFDGALIKPKVALDLYRVLGVPDTISRYGILSTTSEKAYYYIGGEKRITCRYPEHVTTPIGVSFSKTRSAYFNEFALLDVEKGKPKKSHSGSILFQIMGGKFAICGLIFAGGSSKIGVIPIKSLLKALSTSKSGNGLREDVGIKFKPLKL